MIAEASIQQLKALIDIIDIISHYIQIKKSGANYSACCPFHDEKTPSFMVSPSKGFYHCYGCGVGGDAIKFVMEYEKLSFTEAIEKIASLVGFTLEYTKSQKRVDFKFLDKVAEFYQNKLSHSPEILDYLGKRGLTAESIAKFHLGFCGAGFESVKLADQYNARREAIELGILGEDDQRVYARFFNRIMFPICSPNGQIIGFGGRSLDNAGAKYINSPQTKVFNKSKLLYGYHLAKEKIYSQKQIIITEGYLDVIMLHQAGFQNVVATLGTALTPDHLPLLNKGEPQIIVSYDGDKAGINAAFKASKLLASNSKDGGVVIFANGADPADMILAQQEQEVRRLFASPIPFVEFVLREISKAYDLTNPIQKEHALKECLEFLRSLSPVIQEEYKHFTAKLLKIQPHLINIKRPKAPKASKQHANLAELVLIKSILESPHYLELALEYLQAECFESHQSAFELILQGELEHPTLIGIRINEDIKALTEKEFQHQVFSFLLNFYEKKLKTIPLETGISYNQKLELIAKYRSCISQIRERKTNESFSLI
ncbi:DNA primase [Helicobacter enhydrae]|uniref:DNA primase n=1 Tax=Helicobacter enhydrae TaxID=222136 RepID=A0A1B1U605_9HELI|nr:DNA primase [Helicobacter enhydrae]ANV98213.1 DNA primase [Helicobacter enhydrae]